LFASKTATVAKWPGFCYPAWCKNVEAYSAGSKPSGKINPKAIAAMKEIGYDLSA
jgi:protein-tyrosine-phosphatase